MFRNLKLAVGMLAAGALLLTGCGATAKQDSGGGGADSSQPISGLRFMVPNTAGSGYDTTARAAAKVMDDNKITSNIEVFNLAGAGGTVGLSRTVSEKGNGKLIMMMGLGVVGAQYTNKTDAKLDQTTPIAKLIEESGAIVVAKNSPYKSIQDLVAAWKADPKSMAVGGGSSPGGPDHLLPMQLAQTFLDLGFLPLQHLDLLEAFLATEAQRIAVGLVLLRGDHLADLAEREAELLALQDQCEPSAVAR